MSIKLKGAVKFINLESGFWGIIDENGKEWLPVNLDEEFHEEGCEVIFKATEYDGFTMQMWGTPIEILSIEKTPKK